MITTACDEYTTNNPKHFRDQFAAHDLLCLAATVFTRAPHESPMVTVKWSKRNVKHKNNKLLLQYYESDITLLEDLSNSHP
jgi:hypothetical protein